MKKSPLLPILLSLLLVSSCKTSEKILYMQDAPINQPMPVQEEKYITIRPLDVISIVVSSKDPQLAALFNLPRVAYEAGMGNTALGGNMRLSNYTVDEEGMIDFPVLGEIQAKGKTRRELAAYIKNELISRDLIKDPVVTIDYVNLKISVLGEVKSPGRYSVDRDQITLMDAISIAGDLTIYGKRDGVMVIREDESKRTTYKVDLRSSSLFDSPVYYLRQNDIVYVEPNTVRAGQSTINENSVKSVSLWITMGSFLSSLAVLIVNLAK